MKWIKITVIYGLLVYFLKYLYQDITPYILLHYPFFDFRYLIFVIIQIFWSYIFYQIVYQYLYLDTLISLRLSKRKKYEIFLKQWFKYISFYTLIHIFFFIFFSLSLSFGLIALQLILWSLVFIFLLVFYKIWSYHYVSMILIMIGIHLFI